MLRRWAGEFDPQVIIICVMTLVIMLGSGVIAPVLPLLAQEFGVSYAGAGGLVSAFALGRIPFDFIGGTLVDRISPRFVASGGAALVTLSALLSTQVESFGFLLVYRLIGGIGSALFIITAMAFLVRTVAPKRMGQAMGFYQSMLLLGVSFGPSVGGVAASFFDSLYAPFWAMTVLSFAVTLMCLRWIGEFPRSSSDAPDAPTQPVSMYQVLRQLIWDPTFLFACLLTFLTFAVRSGMMMTLVPLFAQETAQVTETGIGSLQSASSFANLLILWHAGRLLDHIGRRRVAIPFLCATALSIVVFPWATTFGLLLLASAAFGLVSGYLGPAPAAIIADIAPKGTAGAVMGLYRMSGDFGLLLGPIIIGWAAGQIGVGATFVGIACFTLLVAVFGFSARETLHEVQRN